MITRTQNGYALGNWEGIPTTLPTGRRLTPGEVRAAVCRANGLTQKEAARELHCSPDNVKHFWGSIYFKLDCRDVVVAINKLIDVGALHRVSVMALLALLIGVSVAPNASARRPPRPVTTAAARTVRNKKEEAGEQVPGASSVIEYHLSARSAA